MIAKSCADVSWASFERVRSWLVDDRPRLSRSGAAIGLCTGTTECAGATAELPRHTGSFLASTTECGRMPLGCGGVGGSEDGGDVGDMRPFSKSVEMEETESFDGFLGGEAWAGDKRTVSPEIDSLEISILPPRA